MGKICHTTNADMHFPAQGKAMQPCLQANRKKGASQIISAPDLPNTGARTTLHSQGMAQKRLSS
jgi:hypothetical protein